VALPALVAALALVHAAAPHAHVIPSPTFVESGATATVELAGPNERTEPMTGFAILVPDGIRILRAEPEGPWQVVEASASQTAWAGGSLAPNEEVTFRVELEATMRPGPTTLDAEQRYPGGDVVRWEVPLTVVPGAQERDPNLAAALAVGAVGLLVLAAIAFFAWRRRSRPLPGDGS
jgi:hypothetical protein